MLGGAMWLDLANRLWVDYSVNTFGELAIYVEKDKSFFMSLPKVKCRWVKEVKKKISNVNTFKESLWYFMILEKNFFVHIFVFQDTNI